MNELSAWSHACAEMPKEGLTISRDPDYSDAWFLTATKEVDEQRLIEDANFENVRDIIWQSRIEIRYCPYCSQKLVPEHADFEGEFDHHDFTR